MRRYFRKCDDIPDIFYILYSRYLLSFRGDTGQHKQWVSTGRKYESVSILGVLHISAFSKLFCFQERHQIMKVKSRFASDKKRTNLSNSLLESKSSEDITEAVFSEIVKGVPMSSRVIYYSIAQIQQKRGKSVWHRNCINMITLIPQPMLWFTM